MNIIRGPLLYRRSNTDAIVWWESDSVVTYGHALEIQEPASDPVIYSAKTSTVQTPNGKASFHRVYLSSLEPDSLISARVVGPDFRASTPATFRTFGDLSEIQLGVVSSAEGFFAITYPGLAYILDKIGSVDGYLSCGGLVGLSDKPDYTDWANWHDAVSPFVSFAPMLVAKASTDISSLSDIACPTSFPDKRYFAVSLGAARVVVLDTTVGGRSSLDAAQKAWAINEFNSNTWKSAKFRIIMMSDPPRVTLWDQTRSYGGGTGTDRFLYRNLLPLIQQSGADFVMAGRCHSYQRGVMHSTYPNHEGMTTHYAAIGGSSPAHQIAAWQWSSSEPPGILLSSSAYHYAKLAIRPTGMVVSVYDLATSAVIDEFSVEPHTLY
ncbi:MAG: hypothetical protein E6R03_09070 [Hyphomicrobiaceae bacterium]|nr:MAG: hypothetical protein E6R03_09070 [Hyphomicrobiaceae bacterium]